MPSLPRHFSRFALIGAFGTAAHFAALFALVHAGLLSPVWASQAGALLGALVNYLLNRRFNYRSESSHLITGPRFFLVAAAGFVLNGLSMALLAETLQFNLFFAQCISTGLVLAWNFLANHFWTFGSGIEGRGNAGRD